MPFYVYIIANGPHGKIYIGHTDNLPERIWQHRNKVFPGYSAKHGCRFLVWYDEFPTREEAKTRERQMKWWKRAWKIDLIEKLNPEWDDLYETLNC